MKTLTPAILIALLALTGCSADDLAGPDRATDPAALESRSASAQFQSGGAALDDFTAESFPADGAWQASDRRGTVTLFLSRATVPVPITSRRPIPIEGKGIFRSDVNRPLSVSLEGEYRLRTIALTLFTPDGETLAKGEGLFSTDLSAFKVVLTYPDGRQRALEFNRL